MELNWAQIFTVVSLSIILLMGFYLLVKTSNIIPDTIKAYKKRFTKNVNNFDDKLIMLHKIKKAIIELKILKKGATIIIDNHSDVSRYITSFVKLDALLSYELLVNVFEGNKSLLHDGAVIIGKDGRVKAAGAYIKLIADDKNVPLSFGTRHRSALGITSKTSSITIVLSEESGKITIFIRGKYVNTNINDFIRTLNSIIEK